MTTMTDEERKEAWRKDMEQPIGLDKNGQPNVVGFISDVPAFLKERAKKKAARDAARRKQE